MTRQFSIVPPPRMLDHVFARMPADTLEKIVWLDELRGLVDQEICSELQKAYFAARIEGRLDAALDLAPHGRKTFLAMTRHENDLRGRMVRWGDGNKA